MISTRKSQIAITLILGVICTGALGTGPNEVKTELKFEISTDTRGYSGIGTIKRTHIATLYKNHPADLPRFHDPEEAKALFDTRGGQGLSQKQRDFLMVSKFANAGHKDDRSRRGYEFFYNLYAVSEDDAKRMAEAVVEFWTDRAKARAQSLRNRPQELRQKIARTKETLLEKRTELSTTEEKLQEKLKEGPHFMHELARNSEAIKEAHATILEMNRILDSLNIEIAGIEAKLSAARDYRNLRSSRRKNLTDEGLSALELILINHTIELAGASARRNAALDIRRREQEFCALYKKWESAGYAIDKLKNDLNSCEHHLLEAKERLANPTPELLPPEIYQNKVMIHPVRVEE